MSAVDRRTNRMMAIKTLIEFENHARPSVLRLGGFPVWHLLRTSSLFRLLGEKGEASDHPSRPKVSRVLMPSMRIRIRRLMKQGAFAHPELVVFTNAKFRRGYQGNIGDNPFVDSFLEYVSDRRYMVVEFPSFSFFDELYEHSTTNWHVLPADRIFLSAVRWWMQSAVKASRLQSVVADQFSGVPEEYRSLAALAKEELPKQYVTFSAVGNALRQAMSEFRPKVVVDIAGAGRFSGMIWGEETQVVEVQHGVIHRSHEGYAWSEQLRQDTAPFFSKRVIAVYSEVEKRILEELGWQREQVVVTGNPRYAKLMLRARREVCRDLELQTESRIVLVTTQPGYRHVIREYVDYLLASLPDGGVVVLKVHPVEAQLGDGYYAALETVDRVRLVKDEKPSLPELLSVASVHLTVSSTVAIEAAYFGVPNVLVGGEYDVLIEAVPTALCADDPPAAVSIVRQLLEASRDEYRAFEPTFHREAGERVAKLVLAYLE